VLVAPPRALGVIRQAATPNLRKAVRAEIDKDYVRMPVHEIEKHLAA
jgi:protein required for attachment to host cells